MNTKDETINEKLASCDEMDAETEAVFRRKQKADHKQRLARQRKTKRRKKGYRKI